VKKFIFICVLFGAILVVFGDAFAFTQEKMKEILQGLGGIHLVVERLRPEIERDGLYGNTLESDMELTLRMAGIKILSEEEFLQSPGAPCLYLYVDALKYADGYVYKIHLSLGERVSILRKQLEVRGVTVSLNDQLGLTHDLAQIREEAKDLVDEFSKAWLAANPSERSK
jgi:hypothetical protein